MGTSHTVAISKTSIKKIRSSICSIKYIFREVVLYLIKKLPSEFLRNILVMFGMVLSLASCRIEYILLFSNITFNLIATYFSNPKLILVFSGGYEKRPVA